MSRGVVLHITKSELKETIKEEIRNYLLLERDLTQVKDPKTLTKIGPGGRVDMSDRAKRAQQMRAKRAKAQKTKEPSTWDAIKGFFTDVESEEATADRDYAARKKDAEEMEKMSPGQGEFALPAGVKVGASEKEIAAAHKKEIGSRAVGAAAQTDVRNYYYNFFMARLAAQGLAWATKWLGSERITKPIRDIVQKNAKALAMRVAAKAGLTAMGGPLAPKLLIALTVAEMAPFIAEIQQDVSLYLKGRGSSFTRNQIQRVRVLLLGVKKEIKSNPPGWKNSGDAGRYAKAVMDELRGLGVLQAIEDYKENPRSFSDRDKKVRDPKTGKLLYVANVDDQLPRYAMRLTKLLKTLGPGAQKKKQPTPSRKKEEPRVAQDTTKPKKKTLTRKQYKRKFRNIMRKAGTKYGKNGKWTGLPRQHPARVAYRDFARISRKVPSGIQSELRSLGLLT